MAERRPARQATAISRGERGVAQDDPDVHREAARRRWRAWKCASRNGVTALPVTPSRRQRGQAVGQRPVVQRRVELLVDAAAGWPRTSAPRVHAVRRRRAASTSATCSGESSDQSRSKPPSVRIEAGEARRCGSRRPPRRASPAAPGWRRRRGSTSPRRRPPRSGCGARVTRSADSSKVLRGRRGARRRARRWRRRRCRRRPRPRWSRRPWSRRPRPRRGRDGEVADRELGHVVGAGQIGSSCGVVEPDDELAADHADGGRHGAVVAYRLLDLPRDPQVVAAAGSPCETIVLSSATTGRPSRARLRRPHRRSGSRNGRHDRVTGHERYGTAAGRCRWTTSREVSDLSVGALRVTGGHAVVD